MAKAHKGLFTFFLLLLFSAVRINAATSDTTRIQLLLDRSVQLQRSNQDSCYKLAEEAYRLSLPLNYHKGVVKSFIRMGSVLMTRGYNDSALAFMREALAISKALNDPQYMLGCYILLSYGYQYKGWQDSAYAALYQGMQYSVTLHDTASLIHIHNALAALKYDYRDYKGATTSYLTAARLAQLNGNTELLLTAYMGLGNAVYKQNLVPAALHYYLRANSLASDLNDTISRLQNLNNIALCYGDLKTYDSAIYYYDMALQGYLHEGLQSETANARYNLGNMYIDMGKADQALQELNKALRLAVSIDEQQRTADCYQSLSRAYALKGDFIKAYQFQVQYTALADSLLNAEKVNSISEMQVKYETEKKETEIQLLDAQGKTSIAQRNFFIAGSIVLLLGLFILAFYYVQRQKIAAHKEEIAKKEIDELLNTQEIKTFNAVIEGQEEERQRIATDLHDRLGSMLATVKVLFSGLESKIDRAHEEHIKQYDKAGSLLDEACQEVRRISHNMSTSMVMSFGLAPALRELCDSIDSSGLIKCQLLVYGTEIRVDQQVEIGCYRIVQELMSNILKHAKAKKVSVQLNYSSEQLTMTVEDDGVGFDPHEKMKASGMGLHNIDNRARQLNGTFHVDSSPGRGTISIIEIPLNENNT